MLFIATKIKLFSDPVGTSEKPSLLWLWNWMPKSSKTVVQLLRHLVAVFHNFLFWNFILISILVHGILPGEKLFTNWSERCQSCFNYLGWGEYQSCTASSCLVLPDKMLGKIHKSQSAAKGRVLHSGRISPELGISGPCTVRSRVSKNGFLWSQNLDFYPPPPTIKKGVIQIFLVKI